MTGCAICEQLKQKKDILGESEHITVLLAPQPAVDGHILIVPKQHAAIAEQLMDGVVAEMFTTANKISSTLFDKLGAQGTNLLLQNGLAAGQSVNHVTLNVIPRTENDGLNLQWQPKQLTEEEMVTIEATLKAEAGQFGALELTVKQTQPTGETVEVKEETAEGEIDYQIKQLERIP